MMKLRFVKLSLLVALLVLFPSDRFSAFADESQPVLKIGIPLSLSGGLEEYGNYVREGFELGADASSAVKVKLVFEDDRSVDKVATLSAVKKLIAIDNVDVLYLWSVAATPPLVPVVTAAHIPMIAGAYDRNIAHSGPYVFGCEVNYFLLAPKIADFMVKNLGAKKIAILSANDYWSQSYPDLFQKEVLADGATITVNETVNTDATDLRSLILRIIKSGAEGIFAPLYGNSLYALARQARELHFAGKIEGADGIFEDDVRSLGADAEGIYAAQFWTDDEKFREHVKQKFGAKTSALQLGMIASGYDVVTHLRAIADQIHQRKETISREMMLLGIKTYHSNGILGPMFLGAPPVSGGEEMVVVHHGAFELAK